MSGESLGSIARTQLIVIGIVALFISCSLVSAQPLIVYEYTTPVYPGGSITVRIHITNQYSLAIRVSKLTVSFDWGEVYVEETPKILLPGDTYDWTFADCHVPSNASLGVHFYGASVLVATASSSGGWNEDQVAASFPEFVVSEFPFPKLERVLFLAIIVCLLAILIGCSTRIRRTIVERHFVMSLILSGAACSFATYFMMTPDYDPAALISFGVVYLIILCCTFVLYPLIHYLLRLYRGAHRLFRKSVETYSSLARTRARVGVGIALSLSYWILAYFALWPELVKELPMATAFVGGIPSARELGSWPVVLLSMLVCGIGGPATIHAITWFRGDDPAKDTGKTTLVLFELLCFFSGLYLIGSGARNWGSNQSYYFGFGFWWFLLVLPGTLASVAMLRFLDASDS